MEKDTRVEDMQFLLARSWLSRWADKMSKCEEKYHATSFFKIMNYYVLVLCWVLFIIVTILTTTQWGKQYVPSLQWEI